MVVDHFLAGCLLGQNKAEVELRSSDATEALAAARAALDVSMAAQGLSAYSSLSGQSWLMLARVLQARNELQPAREALDKAVKHLSSTVDAQHPDLVRARELQAQNI